jgi:hypothetical protein
LNSVRCPYSLPHLFCPPGLAALLLYVGCRYTRVPTSVQMNAVSAVPSGADVTQLHHFVPAVCFVLRSLILCQHAAQHLGCDYHRQRNKLRCKILTAGVSVVCALMLWTCCGCCFEGEMHHCGQHISIFILVCAGCF